MWEELGAANEAYERRLVTMALVKTNYSYIKNISHFRKKARDKAPISLLEAMFNSQQALSSVPHDKVFALLGLCQDSMSLVSAPNYEQPIEELLQDLTRKFMVVHRSLDFILAADPDATANSALPSWTPNWVGTWNPSAVELQTQGLEGHQNTYFEAEGSLPHSLKVIGKEIAIAYSWGSDECQVWYSSHYYGGSYAKIQEAIGEALFYDCFPSLELGSRGLDENGVGPKELDFEQRLSRWFEAARRFLSSLGTLGHKRSALRQAIHVIHLEEHPICSSKGENPWLAEEEPWTRHLCFHPSCTFDYELKSFDDVMSWLDKALFSGGVNPHIYDDCGMPLQKTEYRTQEADLVGYTSEMARSTIRAARKNRVFLKTKKGDVGIANARIMDGDLICQLQGCSELVILRQMPKKIGKGRSS